MLKKTIKIIQIRSTIGCQKKHRATMCGLGLRHINHVVKRDDNSSIRGMVKLVSYLIKIEE